MAASIQGRSLITPSPDALSPSPLMDVPLRVHCPGRLMEGGGGEAGVVAASLGLLHLDAGGGSGSPHFPDAVAAGRLYLSAAIHPNSRSSRSRGRHTRTPRGHRAGREHAKLNLQPGERGEVRVVAGAASTLVHQTLTATARARPHTPQPPARRGYTSRDVSEPQPLSPPPPPVLPPPPPPPPDLYALMVPVETPVTVAT